MVFFLFLLLLLSLNQRNLQCNIAVPRMREVARFEIEMFRDFLHAFLTLI